MMVNDRMNLLYKKCDKHDSSNKNNLFSMPIS